MNRASKGIKNAPFKSVDSLQPGEWTIVDTEPKNRNKHTFKIYIRLNKNENSPFNGSWEEPIQISGIRFASVCNMYKCKHRNCDDSCLHKHCENAIFKNFIVKHFLNDGYNLHGKCHNIFFENIAAIECGDDGISAHSSIKIDVKNYVSIGNSTGICHINFTNCSHNNVYI